jgi:hypothetical protein
MMATRIVPPPAAPIDHAALDVILTHLERRYGLDPRLDRAFRLFMAGNVSLFEQEPTTALVVGDSGQTYTATALGYCSCPDAERGNRCKHQLATRIAVQMRAVEEARQAEDEDVRAQYQRLCVERSQLGARISSQGMRPIDDPTFVEMGEWLSALRSQIASR